MTNEPHVSNEHGNDEEYDNPVRYDLENEQWKPELPLLTQYAEGAEGRTILEIGCGTGRTAIPLAEAGYTVTGIDLHEGMLELARRKAADKNAEVEWIAGDIADLRLPSPAGFAYMTGNGFQHFLRNEDQDALLSAVSRNLRSGGVFLFDTRFPGAEELMQPESEQYWRAAAEGDGTETKLYTIARYDAVTQIQHYTTIRRRADGSEERTRIDLRYTYPQELRRLLERAGFGIEGLYADWDRTPLHPGAYSMICVCRKK
ncbi:class I SAM-dependent DNA methyltransferase [Saccharibacillus alkalitolerans]|uniref:Class I SAM-dependent methyltransferase n=1 Tax=Saccharibacillus alkalitolerans TaxID=2705290 RepID=A0ABX0FA31_9BACL|nr:class I SAM-dependent methyltransferase [Saccharibacillus alkalitolerans]NGZ77791.1 class I SAM-dependent methyltransferase [Saccharibacillus alkalitolerans]